MDAELSEDIESIFGDVFPTRTRPARSRNSSAEKFCKKNKTPIVPLATPIHPKYLGVGSEPEAGLEILIARWAQNNPLTSQNRKVGAAHAGEAIGSR